ncbi:hypothetical protein GGI06_003306, partial [Coemansia sp. S85]
TVTKTCAEYCPITVERPHTEYVPSPISITDTEFQTVTMCQPVTVSVPITEYDTICQIVTVDHTATMTKPVLVVQNVCTEGPSPPPPPPPPPPHVYGDYVSPYELNGRVAMEDEVEELDQIAKKGQKKGATKIVPAKKAVKVL